MLFETKNNKKQRHHIKLFPTYVICAVNMENLKMDSLSLDRY